MFFFISLELDSPILLYICYIENSSNDILHKFIFCINLKKESYVNDDRLVIVRWTINLRVSFLVDHFLSLLNIVAVFFFFSFLCFGWKIRWLEKQLPFLFTCLLFCDFLLSSVFFISSINNLPSMVTWFSLILVTSFIHQWPEGHVLNGHIGILAFCHGWLVPMIFKVNFFKSAFSDLW